MCPSNGTVQCSFLVHNDKTIRVLKDMKRHVSIIPRLLDSRPHLDTLSHEPRWLGHYECTRGPFRDVDEEAVILSAVNSSSQEALPRKSKETMLHDEDPHAGGTGVVDHRVACQGS